MKIIENKHTYFIDGYLNALSDIDGAEKREVVSRAFFIQSNTIDLEKNIKLKFDDMNDIMIIEEIKYATIYGIVEGIFEKILLTNPFDFIHNSNNYKININTINNYRGYVIFHLIDYIDFAFEDVGVDFLTKGIVSFALMKNQNQNFIVLVIQKNDISLFFVFFKNKYDEKQLKILYDHINAELSTKYREIQRNTNRKKIMSWIKNKGK